MKAGEIKTWLDQGIVLLLEKCKVEADSIAIGESNEDNETEEGWAIYLLETGEILTVHTETLTDVERLSFEKVSKTPISTADSIDHIRVPNKIV